MHIQSNCFKNYVMLCKKFFFTYTGTSKIEIKKKTQKLHNYQSMSNKRKVLHLMHNTGT